jgi:hypothetical protein
VERFEERGRAVEQRTAAQPRITRQNTSPSTSPRRRRTTQDEEQDRTGQVSPPAEE